MGEVKNLSAVQEENELKRGIKGWRVSLTEQMFYKQGLISFER